VRYTVTVNGCTAYTEQSVEIVTLCESITSGLWSTSSVWSCGRIPTAVDAVRINIGHTVTLPASYVGHAASLDLQGTLTQQLNASLSMGQ
jgi:hypothetical protein